MINDESDISDSGDSGDPYFNDNPDSPFFFTPDQVYSDHFDLHNPNPTSTSWTAPTAQNLPSSPALPSPVPVSPPLVAASPSLTPTVSYPSSPSSRASPVATPSSPFFDYTAEELAFIEQFDTVDIVLSQPNY